VRTIATWLSALLVVIGVGVAIEAGVGVAGSGRPAESSVEPLAPSALAVGPGGRLYIADDQRDQILALLPDGSFTVLAGTGTAGFSGDGGPAVEAEINDPAGMVVTADGTIYFADEGNERVRMITPGGIITTVAGDGRWQAGVSNGTPAREAQLDPTAVAIGPDGELYIACEGNDQVLRLTPGGRLDIVVGPVDDKFAGPSGIGGPAVLASPDSPNGLAFDRAGDLFISGDATKDLLMVDIYGVMHRLRPYFRFYARGPGGLTTAANGAVYGMDDLAIVRVSAAGETTFINFLDHPLFGKDGGAFLPNGIAIGADGVIYTDTDGVNGYSSVAAIVAIAADGQVKVLWHGPAPSNQR
jgi:hypothetical protein